MAALEPRAWLSEKSEPGYVGEIWDLKAAAPAAAELVAASVSQELVPACMSHQVDAPLTDGGVGTSVLMVGWLVVWGLLTLKGQGS